MDDLPEEVTLELRLEGWEETCHGRTEKIGKGQGSEAGTHRAFWKKGKRARAAREKGRLFREEADEMGAISYVGP